MRVIQVGIGGMGNVWLQTVLDSKRVEFAGFVEVNEAVIDAQVAKHGLDRALVFPTLDAALDSVQTDAIINVTPPQFHREVSICALEAGLPVLSEKPLAPTPADAQAIVDAANQTGVLHVVTQNYRYSTVAQTLKKALDPAVMGVIGALTVEFFKGPHFGGFREQMPYPLIVDMSIHHFDLMRFFLGADPLSVFGRSWNPPWSWFAGDASASVSLEFAGGMMASYSGTWCGTGRETTWNGDWRFDCENGVVALSNDQVWVYPRQHDDQPYQMEQVVMPLVAQAYLLDEFCTAVEGGAAPATTCHDNIKSLGIVFSAVDSFESGGVIRL